MNQFTQEELVQYSAMTEKFNNRCAEFKCLKQKFGEK